jgi:DNA-binding transcriptional regulator GbsR (MarR family)
MAMASTLDPLTEEFSPKEIVFIEKMGLHYERTYGIPRIGGRILGVLMLSAEAQTIEQLRAKVQVSHGSVSTNLRLLSVLGMVEKVTLSGERSDFYQFSTHAWQQVLLKRLESIEVLKTMAEQGLADLEPQGAVRQRFEEMLAWVNIGHGKYLEFLEEWQNLGRERDDENLTGLMDFK